MPWVIAAVPAAKFTENSRHPPACKGGRIPGWASVVRASHAKYCGTGVGHVLAALGASAELAVDGCPLSAGGGWLRSAVHPLQRHCHPEGALALPSARPWPAPSARERLPSMAKVRVGWLLSPHSAQPACAGSSLCWSPLVLALHLQAQHGHPAVPGVLRSWAIVPGALRRGWHRCLPSSCSLLAEFHPTSAQTRPPLQLPPALNPGPEHLLQGQQLELALPRAVLTLGRCKDLGHLQGGSPPPGGAGAGTLGSDGAISPQAGASPGLSSVCPTASCEHPSSKLVVGTRDELCSLLPCSNTWPQSTFLCPGLDSPRCFWHPAARCPPSSRPTRSSLVAPRPGRPQQPLRPLPQGSSGSGRSWGGLP